MIIERTSNEYGKGKIVSKLFRTRETDSDDEDLTHLGIAGLQSDGSLYPTVANLRVEPTENTPRCSGNSHNVSQITSCKLSILNIVRLGVMRHV